jgi:transcriptional regulator with XRE-family HTH domain
LSRVKFPTQPLREIAQKRLRDGASLEEIANAMGLTEFALGRVLYNQSRRYISLSLADRIACALGLHLALLWPDEYATCTAPDEAPPNCATVAQLAAKAPLMIGKRQTPKPKPVIWVDDAKRARMEASA